MRLVKCLATISFLLALFLVVILLEQELSEQDTAKQESIFKEAFAIVEKLNIEARLDYQIQRRFGLLQEDIIKNVDGYFSGKVDLTNFSKQLPPHTLALVGADKDGTLLRFANLRGSMDKRLAKSFVKLANVFKVLVAGRSLVVENAEQIKDCDKLLGEFIGNKSAQTGTLVLRSARVSVYNSKNENIWFYWDHFTSDAGESIFLFSRLDVSNVDRDYVYRSNLAINSLEGMKFAYFNESEHKFLAEDGFSQALSLNDQKRLAKECLKKSAGLARGIESEITTISLKKHLAIVGRHIGRADLWPVVIVEDAQQKNSLLANERAVLIFIAICLFLILSVNSVVFARGLTPTVRFALVAAIILAIFMPFFLGRSVFKLILFDAYAKEKIQLERDLHQSLLGIDKSFNMTQLNLNERLKQILKDPEILRKIRLEEKIVKKGNDVETSVLFEIVESCFANLVAGYEDQVFKMYRTINSLVISGPDDFVRYFNKYHAVGSGHDKSLKNSDSIILLMKLFINKKVESYSKSDFSTDFWQQFKKDRSDAKLNFLVEEVVGRLKTSFGIDKFHNLVNAMGLEVLFRTGLGKGYVTVFPITYAGKYRYFVGAVWDEYAIGPTFLRRAFDQRVVADQGSLDKEESSFYHKLDPGSYIRKKPVSFMAFDGFRFDLFATSNDNRQIMANLLKRASRSKVLLKHETKGEKATLFVAYPGQNLGVYVIGIQQNIAHLKKIEDVRAIYFLAGLILFVLFSVLAAINISASFTNPLQHLLWGLGEVQKNNYSIKLKDSREDEFGSISKAFNLMTRRLQEKDVLGRFVSDSVKKLAANPELLKKARDGSEEEVTILFSSLKGFGEVALQESESEIQKILEFSLRKFFARAEEFGGEIDKVIGEKILIVFPHRKKGRKKAVAAAISLVKNINKDFAAEKQVKPVFGLNIGKVISGIIGTPAVRMDYTVIGDPVNVAARLCSVAEDFDQTLVTSGLVCEIAGKTEKFEKIEIEKIKGKKQEVEVFKVKV